MLVRVVSESVVLIILWFAVYQISDYIFNLRNAGVTGYSEIPKSSVIARSSSAQRRDSPDWPAVIVAQCSFSSSKVATVTVPASSAAAAQIGSRYSINKTAGRYRTKFFPILVFISFLFLDKTWLHVISEPIHFSTSFF